MKKLLIFAGASEGRLLAGALEGRPVQVTVCVATEYGKALLSPGGNVEVTSQRMDTAGMAAYIRTGGFGLVVDATHPYAAEATANIRAAAASENIPLLRLLREEEDGGTGCLHVQSAAEAALRLLDTQGNILLATGVKELAAFTVLPELRQRLYVRTLPAESSLQACAEQNIPAARVLAMQGPFSAALNLALLREWSIRVLVTKNGGKAGGFAEKAQAAAEAGALLVVIGRPPEQKGLSLQEVLREVDAWLNGDPHAKA